MIGNIRDFEFINGLTQNSRDIHRNIANAHHNHGFLGQIKLSVSEIWMAVIPRNKLGGGVTPNKVLASHPQVPIKRTPGCDHHLMVMLF